MSLVVAARRASDSIRRLTLALARTHAASLRVREGATALLTHGVQVGAQRRPLVVTRVVRARGVAPRRHPVDFRVVGRVPGRSFVEDLPRT